MDKKVAIVMSGGGAAGAIELGMLHALREKGFEFKHAYGVSTGALNATGLAHLGLDGLTEMWNGLSKHSDIFKFAWPLGPLYGDGIYHAKPLKKKIEKALEHDPYIPSTVAYVDLESGNLKYSSAGSPEYLEATLASASVPLYTQSVNNAVDGGVREITPLKKAIEDGHEHIVVLLASPWEHKKWEMPKSKWFRALKVAGRALSLVTHEIFKNDIKSCLLKNRLPEYKQIKLEVYAPSKRNIGTNQFEKLAITEAMLQGFNDAMKGPLNLE